jgi:predicted DNA-binding transcriptional regulator YafY
VSFRGSNNAWIERPHRIESHLLRRKSRFEFSAIPPWVEEVHWHPTQKIEKKRSGDLVLHLPAGSLHEARRFVLSFGRHAKALSPKELVEELREEVREMRKGYGA